MAKSTIPPKGSNPVIPTLTAPPVPPADPAQAAPAETKKPKKERVKYTEVFVSEEAAVAEANSRTKGPRRAFKVTLNDQTFFVVANNEGRAGGIGWKQVGGKVEELGGKARKPKDLQSIDAILAALNAMPEAERAAALAQLKNLGAK